MECKERQAVQLVSASHVLSQEAWRGQFVQGMRGVLAVLSGLGAKMRGIRAVKAQAAKSEVVATAAAVKAECADAWPRPFQVVNGLKELGETNGKVEPSICGIEPALVNGHVNGHSRLNGHNGCLAKHDVAFNWPGSQVKELHLKPRRVPAVVRSPAGLALT